MKQIVRIVDGQSLSTNIKRRKEMNVVIIGIKEPHYGDPEIRLIDPIGRSRPQVIDIINENIPNNPLYIKKMDFLKKVLIEEYGFLEEQRITILL